MDQLIANLNSFVANLRRTVRLSGVGHWLRRGRPIDVTAALLEFLAGL